jgi:hypothetical protein
MAANWQIPTVENRDEELLQSLLQNQQIPVNNNNSDLVNALQNITQPVDQFAQDYIVDPLNKLGGGTGDSLKSLVNFLPELSFGADVRDATQGSNQIIEGIKNKDISEALEGAAYMTAGIAGGIPFYGDVAKEAAQAAIPFMFGTARNLNLPKVSDNLTNAVVKQNQIDAIEKSGAAKSATKYDTPDDPWYHATPEEEIVGGEFDLSRSGSNTGAKDAKDVVYFSKGKGTATEYLEEIEMLPPAKQAEYETLIKKSNELEATAKKNNKYPWKEAEWQQARDAYEEAYALDQKFKQTKKSGSLVEVNVKPTNPMTVDMKGEAWDEATQAAHIKQAREDGHDAVIFKNMQDSGWFGGKGADDIIAMFDPKQISIKNTTRYDPWSIPTGKYNTPEFKKWFGNSKVVDEGGKPLTVYHGTISDFDEFKAADFGSGAKSRTGGGNYYAGRDTFFFTDKPVVANDYARNVNGDASGGGNVIPANLSLKNPLVIDDVEGRNWSYYVDDIENARQKGHDGVILKNINDPFTHRTDGIKSTIYAVFEPEKIKSIHNKGKYNPKDANILNSIAPIAGAGVGGAAIASTLMNEKQKDYRNMPQTY